MYFDTDRTSSFMYSAIMTALSAATSAGAAPPAAGAALAGRSGSRGQADASLAASSAGWGHVGGPATSVHLLRPVLHNMRVVKSEAEIRLMRRSAVVAAAGLERCIRGTRPGVGEWQLAAAFGGDA